jgi:hypothetical protein
MLLGGQELEGNCYHVKYIWFPSIPFLTSESAALAPESMCDYSAVILEETTTKAYSPTLPCKVS